MDPVTLIVTALGAGVGAGLKDVTSLAVNDTYTRLRELLNRRLAGRRDSGLILTRHAESPEAWRGALSAELTAAGAAGDADLLAAARELMHLVDPPGAHNGKYDVDVHSSQGVQVGNTNTQYNIFTN